MAYVHQPYPAWRYHRDGRALIVRNEAEHAELVADSPEEWATMPGTFPAEPEAPAAVEPAAPAAPKKARKK